MLNQLNHSGASITAFIFRMFSSIEFKFPCHFFYYIFWVIFLTVDWWILITFLIYNKLVQINSKLISIVYKTFTLMYLFYSSPPFVLLFSFFVLLFSYKLCPYIFCSHQHRFRIISLCSCLLGYIGRKRGTNKIHIYAVHLVIFIDVLFFFFF